jgi:hypothetical protein
LAHPGRAVLADFEQAHFCQIPAVNQEWDHRYLEDLARTEPDAVHVVIRDQAGFHLRDGDTRLDRVKFFL